MAIALTAVLGASALDLALGLLWVASLAGLLLLRRRVSLAPPLVLAASTALAVWGTHAGWFPRPLPAAYERGWVPDRERAAEPAAPAADPRIVAARDRLRALRHEELRLTGAELEQRAGAIIGLSRRIPPLRGAAPREAAALEEASRRLARTLAAAEFRDLEGRRTAAAAHLAELDRRLAALLDASQAAGLLRAADPAAMAHLSLRPVHDDLASAHAAVRALVQALGGGTPSVTAAATVRHDEARGELAWTVRHVLAGAPGLRLLRLETRPFRDAAGGPARSVSLAPAAEGEAPRPLPAGGWAELAPPARGAVLAATWTERAAVRPVRSALRPIAFGRLEIRVPTTRDDVLVAAVLDGHPGVELPLVVPLGAPALLRVALPRHALFFASRPGTVASGPDGDIWETPAVDDAPVALDLVPSTVLLRNPAFRRVDGYLYRPNPATVLVTIGLAALVLVLVRRPRPVAPRAG